MFANQLPTGLRPDRVQSGMLDVKHATTHKHSVIDTCVDRLRDGAVVVVEVQRLQHLVADEYNRRQRDDGHAAWATPEVYKLSTWLGRVWNDYAQLAEETISTLLSVGQANEVWETVIAKSVRSEYQTGYEYLLWHITATANHVKEAYGLICSYDIAIANFPDPVSADVEHFRIWLAAYQQALVARRCIDHECLPDHVGARAEAIFRINQPRLVFAGFDTWTPQRKRLIKSLEQAAVSVEIIEHHSNDSPNLPTRLEFGTTDEELDVCARWARAVIDESPQTHRVGIVAPNLSEIGPRLSRRLSACLNPDAVMEDRQSNNFAFHLTLGSTLAEVPIIVDVMNLLELIRPQVSVDVMVAIVLSDRIKDWDLEISARSKLAEEIYGIGGDRLSIDDVIQLAKRSQNRCPNLLKLLRNAEQMLSSRPRYASYAFWGQFFMEWIQNLQSEKKGERSFGLDEWQAYRTWVSVVQGLAELGFVASHCPVETALAKLIRRVGESQDQPRAVRAPVQVGEYLSMAGQSFTHLWMLGMNEKHLPGSPQPNPFLPVALQKEYGTPKSSATTLNAQIRMRYMRIASSAEHVVQSYARMDGGEHFQRSIYLQQPQPFASAQSDQLAEFQDYPSVIAKDFTSCELLTDWVAPDYEIVGPTSGGSSLLKNQSNCPFLAFASHRLHLRQGPTLEIGVTRLARGSMMHTLAERLCRKYSTDRALQQAIVADELFTEVRREAQAVVDEYSASRVRSLGEDVMDVEVSILTELTMALLRSEANNSDYKVWEVECPTEIQLAGMTLKLKIDRIDEVRLDGQSRFRLIDYKTGKCNINDAIGVRPKDPQLGVYAVAFTQQGHEVEDVAYIQLKDGNLERKYSWQRYCRGRRGQPVEIEDQIKGVGPSWTAVLENLAADFVAGNAYADPLPRACEYCHVSPVCRIKNRHDSVVLPAGETVE